MKLTRQDLIKLCDNFLEGKIDKSHIQEFASKAIIDNNTDWEGDEVIAGTIFEWEDEEMNFEINKTNISLWKNRLLNGQDVLLFYNNWNVHIEKQQEICRSNDSEWKPINKRLTVGVSIDLNQIPIHGLRHPGEKGTTGWFIWTGEYSTANDFFQPMCAEHLLQRCPQIIKYLGLEVGFRFLVDNNGYEDVWYDEKIKEIK